MYEDFCFAYLWDQSQKLNNSGRNFGYFFFIMFDITIDKNDEAFDKNVSLQETLLHFSFLICRHF